MRFPRLSLGLIGLGFACDHAPPSAVPVAAPSGVPSSAPSSAPPVVALAPASATSTAAAPTTATAPASTCAKGQIDACGDCYPPCDTDADCKVKVQTCQPIVCAHTSYGNGCLADPSSTAGAAAGTPVAAAPPGGLECRAKSGTQTFELFVVWKDGNLSSGTLRTTPATGKPSTQAVTAEMVKGLVLVHPAHGPRDKTIATEQTDPSKSLQVGDYKQPWMPCQ
jgi:hypothetical protein